MAHVQQAWTDQQASSDSFDNNLLTFSAAALGLSITFLKDVVPLDQVEWIATLYCSWVCFSMCALVTIASFQIAVQVQKVHAKSIAAYYLEGDLDAFSRSSCWHKMLPACMTVGSIFFCLGITLTIIFTANNISHVKEIKRWQTIKTQLHR